jgi:uncharacterized protein
MDAPGPAALLRIFIGENDVFGDQPLVDALIYKAQQMGLAGATALRGRIGYGGKRHPSPSHLVLSQDRPIVVEVVDVRDKIDTYVAAIDPMVPAGLITVETIEVVRYGRGS